MMIKLIITAKIVHGECGITEYKLCVEAAYTEKGLSNQPIDIFT